MHLIPSLKVHINIVFKAFFKAMFGLGKFEEKCRRNKIERKSWWKEKKCGKIKIKLNSTCYFYLLLTIFIYFKLLI